MKKFILILATVGLLFILAVSSQVVLAGSLAQAAQAEITSAVPAKVSYQGYVTLNGAPYNGTGYFKIAIRNAAGTEGYWSNDGTSGTGEPAASLSLPVVNGLFSVNLGDASMFPLPEDLFSSPDRVLRVWFSPIPSGFTQLSPDRVFTSAPYAFAAENANRLDGQEGSWYQQRVSGTCAPGSTVQAVNADGTVTCAIVEPYPGFSLATVESEGSTGFFPSITIGLDGLPLISYVDSTVGHLKVAHCNDSTCKSATITILDSATNVVSSTSIAIGSDGFGIIAYYDNGNSALKVAHCSNTACTSAAINQVDNSGSVGMGASIAIGTDGLAFIIYWDAVLNNLKTAHCSNLDCSSATIYVMDNFTQTGQNNSLTIGSDGFPLISYFQISGFSLKVAHCLNSICGMASVSTLAGAGNVTNSSITTGVDGMGLISYYEMMSSDLKVAHCSDLNCSSATFTTLDSTSTVGSYSSITIGRDGLGLIAYYDETNGNLKLAHCSNILCSAASISILDSTDVVGLFPAVTVGADGSGLVAYYDQTHGDLKVAHCSDLLCMPYARNR